jgi:hypothetical protein
MGIHTMTHAKAFHEFIELCKYHHNPDLEQFHQKDPWGLFFSSVLSPAPGH